MSAARKVFIPILATTLMLAGCGKSLETSKGTYKTYGLLNQNTAKSLNVCYELSSGNVIWSIILIESVVFPIYFAGFSLFNPVRLKAGPSDTCDAPV